MSGVHQGKTRGGASIESDIMRIIGYFHADIRAIFRLLDTKRRNPARASNAPANHPHTAAPSHPTAPVSRPAAATHPTQANVNHERNKADQNPIPRTRASTGRRAWTRTRRASKQPSCLTRRCSRHRSVDGSAPGRPSAVYQFISGCCHQFGGDVRRFASHCEPCGHGRRTLSLEARASQRSRQ